MTPTRSSPLAVVVVHWNQPEACARTVERFLADRVPTRVVVVDNASAPSELERLRAGLSRWAPHRVTLVEQDRNLGFGPGANAGLRVALAGSAGDAWLALAPHDVEPEPGCLAGMLAAAADEPMAGLMCADVGDGMTPVIDPYFGGMAVPAATGGTGAGPGPCWESVDYPHGTLMMLRRRCLTEVGLFDERYFSYCEEADLALRARRAGWKVGLVRGALVRNTHIGSGMALVDYLQTRNTLLLVREMSGPYHAGIRICFTLVQTLRGVRDPATRSMIFDAGARVAGVRDFLLGRFGPPPPSLTATRRGLSPDATAAGGVAALS